ncbi:hypothetical protein [Halorientalis halophila]|uniref:hypothetical protein n=1 Tax=Halorientalis halophila TaxID=3108499 RepID=UPI003008255E
MADAKAVQQAMRQTSGSNKRFTSPDFETSANETGTRSKIAEHKAIRPMVVREGVSWDVHLPAYQAETTDGDDTNDETFALDHDVIDADGVADDVVIYESGTDRTADATVDYENNEVTLPTPAADVAIDIWYMSDAQARLEVRKVAPSNYHADLTERDAGMLNLRDQSRDPLTFNFGDPFGGAIPTDWKLAVYVDAPYKVRWSGQAGGATPRNGLFTFPVHRKDAEVQGLEAVVKNRLDRV